MGLAALLLVAGCQTRPGAPVQPLALPAPAADTGRPAAVVPTLVPAADLSAGYPDFPGLYWTGEQLATGSQGSIRVLSARPCAELFDQLSAAEWRATARLDSPPGQILWPSLLRLERGDAVALVRADSLHPVTTLASAASLLAPGEQCRAQLTRLSAQPVEAVGAENAQGEAWVYPHVGGCRTITGGTLVALDVMLWYEGPGDFRAVLAMELAAPVDLGERALEPQGLALTVFRSEQGYFDILGEGYAQMRAGLEMQPQALTNPHTFNAASETPGTLTVTGLTPLEGRIDLTHLADEAGTPQAFRAGFRCNG